MAHNSSRSSRHPHDSLVMRRSRRDMAPAVDQGWFDGSVGRRLKSGMCSWWVCFAKITSWPHIQAFRRRSKQYRRNCPSIGSTAGPNVLIPP